MSRVIYLDDPEISVRLNENSRARRFTLRLASQGDGAVLTLPPGVPLGEAQSFLARHCDWLRSALARQPSAIIVRDGASVPVDGTMLRLRHIDGPRRAPEIRGSEIIVQGRAAPGPAIAAWMKERARASLIPSVRRYAALLGKEVQGVALKDTRSRWGSCSTTGRINLSWRLAMAPTRIQDYVAAHEAAHLVEMNHSQRYWDLLAGLMPDYRARRDWLRTEGRDLHRYRFTAR
ncbi:MAG: SprT family zinc-dependent metalloprotease [Pseudomonadota bacterium]